MFDFTREEAPLVSLWYYLSNIFAMEMNSPFVSEAWQMVHISWSSTKRCSDKIKNRLYDTNYFQGQGASNWSHEVGQAQGRGNLIRLLFQISIVHSASLQQKCCSKIWTGINWLENWSVHNWLHAYFKTMMPGIVSLGTLAGTAQYDTSRLGLHFCGKHRCSVSWPRHKWKECNVSGW